MGGRGSLQSRQKHKRNWEGCIVEKQRHTVMHVPKMFLNIMLEVIRFLGGNKSLLHKPFYLGVVFAYIPLNFPVFAQFCSSNSYLF